jgi:hypothetical protein
LSLEQPTVTEQMMRTAANTKAPAFLPQDCFPQARNLAAEVESDGLMRVMDVASCRQAALEKVHGAGLLKWC